MSQAIARQAAEGVKIDLHLTSADLLLASRGELEIVVEPHGTMPPGSGMEPIRTAVVQITVTVD